MPQPTKSPHPIPTLPLLLAGAVALAPAAPAPPFQAPATQVVMLGTGTPNPDPDRSGPGVAVVVNGTAYLVDAGAGVMRRAEQAARNGVTALARSRINIVFLTHLHSDHTIGLPDVIHTGWVVGERAAPLRLIGPPGTMAMAQHLTEAYSADIANRTGGLQPHSENGWKVDATDVREGEVYRDSNVVVTAIRVAHDGWETSLGYRFQTRDRVVVISGDTHATEALATACDGCDVLLHEAYSVAALARRTPDWQKYHADAHTSTTDLAAIATKARPKLLVLYHQLYMGATDDDLIREIRAAGYTGAIVSARDLGIY